MRKAQSPSAPSTQQGSPMALGARVAHPAATLPSPSSLLLKSGLGASQPRSLPPFILHLLECCLSFPTPGRNRKRERHAGGQEAGWGRRRGGGRHRLGRAVLVRAVVPAGRPHPRPRHSVAMIRHEAGRARTQQHPHMVAAPRTLHPAVAGHSAPGPDGTIPVPEGLGVSGLPQGPWHHGHSLDKTGRALLMLLDLGFSSPDTFSL